MPWYCSSDPNVGEKEIIARAGDGTLPPAGKMTENRLLCSIFVMDHPQAHKVYDAIEEAMAGMDYPIVHEFKEDGFGYPTKMYFIPSFPTRVEMDKRPLIPGATARIDILTDNYFPEIDHLLEARLGRQGFRYAVESARFKHLHSNITEVDLLNPDVKTSLGFRPDLNLDYDPDYDYVRDGDHHAIDLNEEYIIDWLYND